MTKKRILLIAPRGSFTEQMMQGFRENDCDVRWVDDRFNWLFPAWSLLQSGWAWRATRRIHVLRRISNQRLAAMIRQHIDVWRPDALFVHKSLLVKPDTIRYAQDRGVRVAHWCPENVAHEPYASWMRSVAGLYDTFFSFDASAVTYMPGERRDRFFVLPFALVPERFQGSMPAATEFDVCFIGAPYPERQEALMTLTALPHIRLGLFGWSGWRATPLARFYRGSVTPEEAAEIYRRSAICINMNLLPETHGVNVKTFEIPAAGGFELTDERAGLKDIFAIEQEVATFTHISDLQPKVMYWLAHPVERQSIAARGRNRVLRDHTMRVRIQQALSIIFRTP